jgi:hypothetical protein
VKLVTIYEDDIPRFLIGAYNSFQEIKRYFRKVSQVTSQIFHGMFEEIFLRVTNQIFQRVFQETNYSRYSIKMFQVTNRIFQGNV